MGRDVNAIAVHSHDDPEGYLEGWPIAYDSEA
jgi:hypothetical protein